MLLRALAAVRQPRSRRATACMEFIDLSSPPSAPRPRRRTSVIDLTAASPPEPLVLSSDSEELPAVPKRGRPRKASPAAAPPAPAVPAADVLPARLLAGRGTAAALRRRGALPVGAAGEPLCRWCQLPVPPPKKTFCSPGCVHEHLLRSNTTYARQQTFARDGGKCASCGVAAHLLYLGAVAAPPGSGLPPGRRSPRWASTAALKATLREAGGRAWRASVAGRAKPIAALLHDAAVAAVAHAAAHTWPPAVVEALVAGDVDGGAPAELRRLAGLEEGSESEEAADVSDDGPAVAGEPERLRLGLELAAWLKGNGFHSVTVGGRGPLRAGDFWAMDHMVPVAEGGGSCGLDNLRTLCTPCHALATRRLAARLALQRRGVAPAEVERLAPPLVALPPPLPPPVTEYPGMRGAKKKRGGRRRVASQVAGDGD